MKRAYGLWGFGRMIHIKSYHIISYHLIKWQNCFKVGTGEPKLKVKLQSAGISDDDVCQRLLEKPHFELAVKGVSRL